MLLKGYSGRFTNTLFLVSVFSITGIINASDKIVGGVEARPGEFPWLVTIKTGKQFCGGALISPSYVITAGHCGRDNRREYVVTAGVHSLNTPSGYEVSSGVKSIWVHPNFSLMNGRNDIALLSLKSPFTFNERVSAIELVPEDYVLEGDTFVAGWGVESENTQVQPDALLKVAIPIVPNDVCKEFYDSKESPIQVSSSVICAGGDGKSSCFGDSGSPLLCLSETTESGLIGCGIVSAGAHCGDTGVYSRVSYFRNWIRSVSGV